MSVSKVDYIIVGLGLAGACIALQLMKARKKLIVIDSGMDSSASRVAAGLFNPVTGRRMTLTWKADKLFPYLSKFYRDAERETITSFYNPMPMFRPFESIEEQNEWMAKSGDSRFDVFIEKVHLSTAFEDVVNNPFGGLMVKNAGYLNTVEFLNAVASKLASNESLRGETFDETLLDLNGGNVGYKDIRANKIIYCVGESLTESRYWKWVPIRPLKGEVLQVSTEVDVPMILNKGVYFVPGITRVGATYNKSDQTREITIAARQELEEKMNALASFAYKITGQAWAMRPTTPDRRPVLGSHPEYPQLVVFNGLGTKGVSLAPYFSGVLFECLENGLSVNEEVDLNRYKSLYWKSA